MLSFFRRTTSDLLNEAHTLGLSALQSFEDLASDLEVASGLAREHERTAHEEADRLRAEASAASTAANRYGASAQKIRALVS